MKLELFLESFKLKSDYILQVNYSLAIEAVPEDLFQVPDVNVSLSGTIPLEKSGKQHDYQAAYIFSVLMRSLPSPSSPLPQMTAFLARAIHRCPVCSK